MNVDKELQKSARKNLRGVDPSVGKYMAALEHEVCRLEKVNAELTKKLVGWLVFLDNAIQSRLIE